MAETELRQGQVLMRVVNTTEKDIVRANKRFPAGETMDVIIRKSDLTEVRAAVGLRTKLLKAPGLP